MHAKVLLAGLASLSQVSAVPSEPVARRAFEDYGIEVLEWEIQAFESGPMLTLNGTIEEVNSQVLEINPDFEFNEPSESELAALYDASAFEKRTDFSGSHYMCDTRDWMPCYLSRIKKGIAHLRGTSGRPKNGPGPGNCGRVSCAGRSAIWWCNDVSLPPFHLPVFLDVLWMLITGTAPSQDRSTKELGAFGSIADGAQYIADRCQLESGLKAKVAGQVFHKTNWNVIVRYDSDNCGWFDP
ncbi:hypothetical protein CMUS01_16276 [Colletotrichum musicola]|uniref:Ecp2 effector protein domain-containing protein n=1 Tax=Colletotrichum musicola TaxID=2175873 RepID=A0A8H6IPP6_9PEZI|nr:hypothetical protein CMUS01_16276 [Colletotrichum musicola]